MAKLDQQRLLKVLYIRPLDLSPDETLFEIGEAAQAIGAKMIEMHNSSHSHDRMAYEITALEMVVREALADADSANRPAARAETRQPMTSGLAAQETVVIHALIELREGSALARGRRIGLPDGRSWRPRCFAWSA